MNIQLENLTKRFPARGKGARGEVTAVVFNGINASLIVICIADPLLFLL